MGSSLVKPSQRESQRRGVNNASASRSEARASNGTFASQTDKGYKVDTLAGPVSNYCKPVTVISPNNCSKTVRLSSNVGSRSSFSTEKRLSSQLESGERTSDYISPVLLKDFSKKDIAEEENARTELKNSLPAIGGGDNHDAIPSSRISQQKPTNRRKFFPASCISKQNKTPEASVNSQLPSEKKDNVKNKGTKKLEVEHDDQDVSRDARTPSPEFNDFENVIVTKPTATLPRSSVSSPIDKYTHAIDSEVIEQEPSPTVSITKSENPAPVHQGELRCELNKTLKTSNTTIANEFKEAQFQAKGDLPPITVGSKTKVLKDTFSHRETQRDWLFERGDLLSDKSGKEKKWIHSYEEKSLTPKNEQNLSSSVSDYANKDYVSSLGLKTPNNDNDVESKLARGQDVTNKFICAKVKLETKLFPEISGLQGCATGATKCFCDINQFDYENGDDLSKSQVPQNVKDNHKLSTIPSKSKQNASGKDIGTERIIDLQEDIEKSHTSPCSKVKNNQVLDNQDATSTSAPNKSETDITSQFLASRLNCLRPDGGGCTLGKFNKDKKQNSEPRPASWSHIDSKQQNGKDEPSARPCSAATGDAMWGYESKINMAAAIGSTKSSACDVSRSPSNSSVPRQRKSKLSVDNDVSHLCEEQNLSDASNKSSRHRFSPLEQKTVQSTSSGCHIESMKVQSNHDFAEVLSAKRRGEGVSLKNRSVSAKSSCISAVEVTSKLSQHSLPRLRARGSSHNLSRSLSNHSSSHNLKLSPRQPSSDSLKHSPRPPSAQSGESFSKKVRSRPSSVQLCGSQSTDLKQHSNHSFTNSYTEKSSFNQTKDKSMHFSTIENDVLSPKNSLCASQIKLPPIKASVTVVQSIDTTPDLSQPLRLPPVVCGEFAGRSSQIGEKIAPSEYTDTLSSWRTSSNLRAPSLPPLTGKNEYLGNPTMCVDSTDKFKSSPADDRANTAESPEYLQTGTRPSLANESPTLDDNAEEADPEPSPSDSHIDCAENRYSSSLTQKSTSDEIARILAKYSSTPQNKTPTDTDTANNVCTVTPSSDCAQDVKTLDKDETESTINFDQISKLGTNIDVSTKGYTAASEAGSVTPLSDCAQRDYTNLHTEVTSYVKEETASTKNFENDLDDMKTQDKSVDYTAADKNHWLTSSCDYSQVAYTSTDVESKGTVDHTAADKNHWLTSSCDYSQVAYTSTNVESKGTVDHTAAGKNHWLTSSCDYSQVAYTNTDVESKGTEKGEMKSSNIIDSYLKDTKTSNMYTKHYTSAVEPTSGCTQIDSTNLDAKETSIDKVELESARTTIDFYLNKVKDNDLPVKDYTSVLGKQKDETTDKERTPYDNAQRNLSENTSDQELVAKDKDIEDNDGENVEEVSSCQLSFSRECPSVSETMSKSESYSTEKFDCESLLKKYSLRKCYTQPCTETVGGESGKKIEDSFKPDPEKTTGEPKQSTFSASEYLADLLSKNATTCTDASKEAFSGYLKTEDHAEKPNNDFVNENKPSSMFDIESIMAKYSAAKSNDTSSFSETVVNDNKSEDSLHANHKNIIPTTKDDTSTAKTDELPEEGEDEAESASKVNKISEKRKINPIEDIYPQNTEASVILKENCDVVGKLITKEFSANDQILQDNDAHDSFLPDTLKCDDLNQDNDFLKSAKVDIHAEEKAVINNCSPIDTNDYLTNLSKRLSGFGERFADISSLTNHCLDYDAAIVTNVAPLDDTANKADEGNEKLCSNLAAEDYCMPKSNTLPAHDDMETPGPNTLDVSKSEGGDYKTDVNSSITEKNENYVTSLNFESTTLDKSEPLSEETKCLRIDESQKSVGNPASGDHDGQNKQNTCTDYHNISTQMDSLLHGAKVQNEVNDSSTEDGQNMTTDGNVLSKEGSTLKASESGKEISSPKIEDGNLESLNIDSLPKESTEQEEDAGDIEGTNTCESNLDKTKTNELISNNATGNVGSNCIASFFNNEVDDMGFKPQVASIGQPSGNLSPSESLSRMSESNLETTTTEVLPSERIDTIKKQVYEEGLKPCQRDGGVAFFIPVSNTGLQPPVNNPDLGDRLAKPKKSSMSYEERMIMADINRQEQLTKKKEFAVKDLINVKSATTSNSSTSGENISGGGQHDRSDRSESGSLH